jgi:hypothetical protein
MEEQTTEQTTGNDITLGDLILMHNIIATVSRRGGFEANEFNLVGSLFEKLKTYIPAKEEDATTETSNASTEDDQMKFEFVEGDTAETVTQ